MSTSAGMAARLRTFRVNVRLQVSSIEAKVLAQLDDGESIVCVGSHVLVHQGDGDLEESRGVVNGE